VKEYFEQGMHYNTSRVFWIHADDLGFKLEKTSSLVVSAPSTGYC